MAEEEIENIEIEEEEDEYLPFAKAEVVRLMKQNLDDDSSKFVNNSMSTHTQPLSTKCLKSQPIHTLTSKESTKKKKESYYT